MRMRSCWFESALSAPSLPLKYRLDKYQPNTRIWSCESVIDLGAEQKNESDRRLQGLSECERRSEYSSADPNAHKNDRGLSSYGDLRLFVPKSDTF